MAEMNLTLAIKGTVDPVVRKAIRDINAINAKLAQDQKKQADLERSKATETRRTSRELKGQISTLSRLESAHQKTIKTQRRGLSIASSTLKSERQRLGVMRQTLAASRKLGSAKGQGAFTAGGAGSNLAQATRNMQSLDRSSRNVSRGMQKVDRDAEGAAQSIKNVGRFSEFAFSVLNAFLLYKGFVFLKTQAQEFVREIVEMQHQIAVTQGMLSGFGQDFKKALGDVVMRVSRETGQALGDLARAQYTIISGGVTGIEESFIALNLAAKAAVAGGIKDVDTAFSAALSQIRAFGLSMDELEDVFDKQFLLIRRGIFTYENFATSVGTISEAFSSMGQDMETANASLVAISQVFTGPQLQRGATALRNAVLQINRASEEFEGLGVDVFDAEGNFRNFLTIVDDLDSALEGMTDKERRKAMEDLFPDKRQMAGMNVLLSNLDVAKESIIEQQFAMGALDDEFDSVSDSLQVQAGIFRNELIPAAEPLVAVFGAAIKGVNSLNSEFEGFTKTVGLLTVAILGLAAAHGALNTQAATSMLGVRGIRGVKGGVAGLIGLSTAAAGAAQGPSAAGFVTAAGVGAAGGGMIGGPIGALAGAGLNAAIFGISTQFEKEGESAAKTFGEAFTDELVASSGDIAAALVAGAANTGMTSTLDDVAGVALGQTRIVTTGNEIARQQQEERGFFDTVVKGFKDAADSAVDIITNPGRLFDGEPTFAPDLDKQSERVVVESGNVADAAIELRDGLTQLDEDVERLGGTLKLSGKDIADARARLVVNTLGKSLPDLPTEALQEQQLLRRGLAEQVADKRLSDKQIRDILSVAGTGRLPSGEVPDVVEPQKVAEGVITGEPLEFRIPPEVGKESVIVAMEVMQGFLEDVANAAPRTFDDIADFMKAPFADVADVFASMGDEGDLLAREFNELARIAQKMQSLQLIESLVGGIESLGEDAITPEQSEKIGNALSGALASLISEISPDGLDALADEDFLFSFADASTAVNQTTEALHPFAQEIENLTNEMKDNSLESKKIQAKAKAQNRELTAEEQDKINRLDLENVQLEINQHNLQQFGEALVAATEAVEGHTEKLEEGSKSMKAGSPAGGFQAGLRQIGGLGIDPTTGQVVPSRGDKSEPGMSVEDVLNRRRGSGIHQFFTILGPETLGDTLQNLKFQRFNRNFTNLMRPEMISPQVLDTLDHLGISQNRGRGGHRNQTGFDSTAQQLMKELIFRFEESSRRGVNITFQGDTVPSELDMRIMQLEQMAPVLVREAMRVG